MPEKVKDILTTVFKNWWKVILIIIIIGAVLSAGRFTLGPLQCEKTEPKIPAWGGGVK